MSKKQTSREYSFSVAGRHYGSSELHARYAKNLLSPSILNFFISNSIDHKNNGHNRQSKNSTALSLNMDNINFADTNWMNEKTLDSVFSKVMESNSAFCRLNDISFIVSKNMHKLNEEQYGNDLKSMVNSILKNVGPQQKLFNRIYVQGFHSSEVPFVSNKITQLVLSNLKTSSTQTIAKICNSSNAILELLNLMTFSYHSDKKLLISRLHKTIEISFESHNFNLESIDIDIDLFDRDFFMRLKNPQTRLSNFLIFHALFKDIPENEHSKIFSDFEQYPPKSLSKSTINRVCDLFKKEYNFAFINNQFTLLDFTKDEIDQIFDVLAAIIILCYDDEFSPFLISKFDLDSKIMNDIMDHIESSFGPKSLSSKLTQSQRKSIRSISSNIFSELVDTHTTRLAIASELYIYLVYYIISKACQNLQLMIKKHNSNSVKNSKLKKTTIATIEIIDNPSPLNLLKLTGEPNSMFDFLSWLIHHTLWEKMFNDLSIKNQYIKKANTFLSIPHLVSCKESRLIVDDCIDSDKSVIDFINVNHYNELFTKNSTFEFGQMKVEGNKSLIITYAPKNKNDYIKFDIKNIYFENRTLYNEKIISYFFCGELKMSKEKLKLVNESKSVPKILFDQLRPLSKMAAKVVNNLEKDLSISSMHYITLYLVRLMKKLSKEIENITTIKTIACINILREKSYRQNYESSSIVELWKYFYTDYTIIEEHSKFISSRKNLFSCIDIEVDKLNIFSAIKDLKQALKISDDHAIYVGTTHVLYTPYFELIIVNFLFKNQYDRANIIVSAILFKLKNKKKFSSLNFHETIEPINIIQINQEHVGSGDQDFDVIKSKSGIPQVVNRLNEKIKNLSSDMFNSQSSLDFYRNSLIDFTKIINRETPSLVYESKFANRKPISHKFLMQLYSSQIMENSQSHGIPKNDIDLMIRDFGDYNLVLSKKTFTNKYNIKDHSAIDIKIKNDRILCYICGRNHGSSRILKCENCDMTFHHRCFKENLFVCTLKKKISASSDDLLGHLRTSSTKVEYSRNVCLHVPSILYYLLASVEKYSIDLEGIYRKTADESEMETILNRFELHYNLPDRYPVPKLELPSENHDTHAFAVLAKQFLMKLKDPIVDEELLSHTASIYETFHDDEKKLDDISKLFVDYLPKSSIDIIQLLFLHFQKINSHQSKNKMSLKSISICISPCIFPKLKPSASASEREYMKRRCDILEFMLKMKLPFKFS